MGQESSYVEACKLRESYHHAARCFPPQERRKKGGRVREDLGLTENMNPARGKGKSVGMMAKPDMTGRKGEIILRMRRMGRGHTDGRSIKLPTAMVKGRGGNVTIVVTTTAMEIEGSTNTRNQRKNIEGNGREVTLMSRLSRRIAAKGREGGSGGN